MVGRAIQKAETLGSGSWQSRRSRSRRSGRPCLLGPLVGPRVGLSGRNPLGHRGGRDGGRRFMAPEPTASPVHSYWHFAPTATTL